MSDVRRKVDLKWRGYVGFD